MAEETQSAKVQELEQKVEELKNEVERVKSSKPDPSSEEVKPKPKKINKDLAKSPSLVIGVVLIAGIVILLLGVVAFAVIGSNFIWLIAIFFLIVILLSGRV